jgi:hypothetical protein
MHSLGSSFGASKRGGGEASGNTGSSLTLEQFLISFFRNIPEYKAWLDIPHISGDAFLKLAFGPAVDHLFTLLKVTITLSHLTGCPILADFCQCTCNKNVVNGFVCLIA